jgi:hypothetical protein
MEATQILKFNAKKELNFTEGLKEKDEVEELEKEEAAIPVEDLKAYLREVDEQ